MSYDLIVMKGEGIGLEIIPEAIKVLKTIAELYTLNLNFYYYEVGESVYKQQGVYLSNEAKSHCNDLQHSSKAAILFGAVADEPIGILRKDYDLFANIRPIKFRDSLSDRSPLKQDRILNTDICIVRELVSDVYYGKEKLGFTSNNIKMASQEMYYDASQIEKVTAVAFELAMKRKKSISLVHKANVIKGVFNLWLDIFKEISYRYPEVKCSDLLVDNMAMQLILRPNTFDVILSSNMFGDILSDVGAGIIGTIGLLPSISMNSYGFALYESIGGTAPDIAGKNIANPISSILSVALFCRYTLKMEHLALLIEEAVDKTLLEARTLDISDEIHPIVSTQKMGDIIVKNIKKIVNEHHNTLSQSIS